MALNDVSLTSGMRANLLSLQGTVNLLDRTQSRLSSGKKVNTAIDNPVSFFASQALTSRATTIDSLKDAMGQAVQTIQAADKGIKAISAMIEQAKGIAQSGLSADANAGVTTVSLTAGNVVADETIIIGGVTLTATAGVPGANQFYVGGSAEMDAISLADAINANAGLTMYTASVSGTVISISKVDTDGTTPDAIVAGDETGTHANITTATVEATTELADLVDQYNEMRTQISELAEDSGYKGKNLLSATAGLRTVSVQFEGTTLDVVGFNATAAGLGVTAATWTTGDATAKINADLELLDAAMSDMRQNSSKLAGNLSIITVRQDFSTNMINTLTEGSDKLTLADANEEGANMLMLQTRQTLSTTALSMSAQAAQSVLRLFQ